MTAPRTPDFVGIVVAAGSSARLPGSVPKQFERIGPRTLLEHAVAALAGHAAVRGVIAVLPPLEAQGDRGTQVAGLPGVLRVVGGGPARADSVRHGLEAAGRPPFVLVHDAARPDASPTLVSAVIEATRIHGAAIPGVPIVDTVKRVGPGSRGTALRVLETLDRSALRLAQTPQGARTDWLVAALAEAESRGIVPTDEAAALELAGHTVAVVDGDPANRKITSREDLRAVRGTAEPRTALRVGTGFDIHRFEVGRRLVLGGVELPGEIGLAGHSDADVVLHAIMDALLGGAALGDIGAYFPPGDPRFRDANSRVLLAEVGRKVAALGLVVVNVDATVLAERPRLRPHVDAMRNVIAETLALDPTRIGIKATTLEGLGALGRAEGIACQAVALLERDLGAP
jgi:2-C-methyl-D-erythritol 4-phosphate cytidylyltransferase / 2-C-methyl-D-erythritol 2,4-cyclodiphosphate synthase